MPWKRKFLPVALTFLLGLPALAGEPAIEEMPDHVTLFPLLSMQAGGVRLLNVDAPTLQFDSSVKEKIGAGISWKGFGGAYGFDAPWGVRPDEAVYGPARSRYYYFHSYTRKHTFDLYLSRNKGFFLSNPEEVGTARPSEGFPKYPDMKSFLCALQAVHVFKADRFSIKAAFDQTERQKKNGGSPLAMVSLFYMEVSNPTDLIPADVASNYPDLRGLNAVKTWGLNGGPGYAYTFSLFRRFYLTPMACLGLGLQDQYLNLENGWTQETVVTLRGNFRLSLGYNGERFFAGTSLIYENFKAVRRQSAVDLVTIEGSLFAGWRFGPYESPQDLLRLLPGR
jgi:hypothetical protein